MCNPSSQTRYRLRRHQATRTVEVAGVPAVHSLCDRLGRRSGSATRTLRHTSKIRPRFSARITSRYRLEVATSSSSLRSSLCTLTLLWNRLGKLIGKIPRYIFGFILVLPWKSLWIPLRFSSRSRSRILADSIFVLPITSCLSSSLGRSCKRPCSRIAMKSRIFSRIRLEIDLESSMT